MSNDFLLSILHISDFHFSMKRHRDQEMVVTALVNDLKTLCVGHRKPDLIMFTGDLVYSADVDSHDQAYDFLIGKVSKATGCSEERVFIAPGNHDLSWTGLEKSGAELNEWRSKMNSEVETTYFNERYSEKNLINL